MRFHKGISLVEVTLVIAIAAVIVMGVVHLYWRTQSRSTVLQATSQIQRIVRAGGQWEMAQRVAGFSAQGSGLLSALVQAKLLSGDDETNPWGGTVSVTGNESGQLVVRLDSIPSSACNLLASRFMTKTTKENFSCYGKNSNDTWEGHF